MDRAQLKSLLESMTLEEKADQLLQLSSNFFGDDRMLTGPALDFGISEDDVKNAGSVLGVTGAAKIKRLQKIQMENQAHHIPMLFMADVINGYKTAFPIPLAQGASFNPDIAKKGAEIAAREAAVSGLHVTFSPMVDLARDARWGRVMESTGEDKYLNSCFAAAMVSGYQGEPDENGGIKSGKLASCLKHFAAYGAPEGGRDYNNVELSERTLREDYFPSYEACVKAGASLAMTSFNTLNHLPTSANRWLLREVLRNEMGFDGVVISDWASIEELIWHGLAADKKEAAKLAMSAGVDIDMATGCYAANLKELVKNGEISQTLLDEAVMRVLELKNKLGLFENPFKDADETKEEAIILCGAHRKAARDAAAECFVLLENDGILPLSEKNRNLLVAGPFADNGRIVGNWSIFADEKDTVTVKAAFEEICGGCTFISTPDYLADRDMLENEDDIKHWEKTAAEIKKDSERIVQAAKKAETVILTLGEAQDMSGEAHSRTDISIPGWQMSLFRDVIAVNKNVIVLLFTGRPLCVKEIKAYARAVLNVWMPGTEGGHAIADIVFGKKAPSGKLPMSFPYSVGQVPVYYNAFTTGRPHLAKYLDAPGKPLYPFGYGKTYTTFKYSEVTLDKRRLLSGGDCIKASVTVTNTGNMEAMETVQLYIRDVIASAVRPVKELKDFQKVMIKPGESKTVVFEIKEEKLRFYTKDMCYKSEPGAFSVFIGGSSDTNNETVFWLDDEEKTM